MANDSKTSYYNYFKENIYDPNKLTQDYEGHILKSVEGHVYVVKTLFGRYKLKCKKARLSFRWPFQHAKLVKRAETNDTIRFDDPIITADGFNATQGQPIKYLYEVVDKNKYLKNVFEQTDLVESINILMRGIIGDIINSASLEDVRHNFSIEPYVGPNGEGLMTPNWMRYSQDSNGNNIDSPIYLETLRKLKNIEEKYGIKIKNISMIDFNEPKQIQEAREAAEAARYNEEKAIIERRIKEKDIEVEAKREALKVKAVLERVKEFGVNNNIDGDRLAQLYIRAITPNATYTNTSFDIGAAASVLQNSQSQTSALQQMVTQQAATIQTLTQQIASMNAAIESMKTALQSQPVAAQAQPTVQSQATAQAQRVTAQAQQATAQAQQATAQAQQATAQAQQVTAQTQQATAQAQQTTAQAQQPVVDQTQPATKKSAVDAALGNKKLVRITSANRVPKASRTNRNGGARGHVPTPRRRSAQNSATQGGRSLR